MLGLLFDHLYKFVYLLVIMLAFFFFLWLQIVIFLLYLLFIKSTYFSHLSNFICEFWTTFLSYISCISSHQVEDPHGLFSTVLYGVSFI